MNTNGVRFQYGLERIIMKEEVFPAYRFKEEEWNERYLEFLRTLTDRYYYWKGRCVIPMVYARKLIEMERAESMTEIECWMETHE